MDPSPAAELDRALASRQLRVTSLRRALWGVLAATDTHLTAPALAEATAAAGHRVGLASVYRTLDLFEELGLVRRARLGDGEADRWEVMHPDDRYHVLCADCGTVEHHGGDLVPSIEDHLVRHHGFETYWVELQVTGTCATCIARRQG